LSLHSRGSGAEIRLRDERQNPYPHGTSRLRSLQFLTSRHRGGGSRGPDGGAAFDITFPEERPGPFALGYGAHFGLGLFLPVSSANRTSSMPRTDGKS
jgi:CRISPR-associated protein Csb2